MQHRTIAKPRHQPVNKAGICFTCRDTFIKTGRHRGLRAAVMGFQPHPFKPEFGINGLRGTGQQPAKGTAVTAGTRKMHIASPHHIVNTLPAKLQAARRQPLLLQNGCHLVGKADGKCVNIVGGGHRFGELAHGHTRTRRLQRCKAFIHMPQRRIQLIGDRLPEPGCQRCPCHAQDIAYMTQPRGRHCRADGAVKAQGRQGQPGHQAGQLACGRRCRTGTSVTPGRRGIAGQPPGRTACRGDGQPCCQTGTA